MSISEPRDAVLNHVKKHAILASIGTDGDVYPFLFLGLELRKRGYQVTLATHDHFADRASAGGLQFCSLVSAAETEQLLVQRDFWHPIKSAWVIARWGGRLIPRQYEILKGLSAGEGTFLVTTPGVLAARLLREHAGVPLISVVLQPWLLPSVHAPPVMMGGLTLPRWTPRTIVGFYFNLIEVIGKRLIGAEFKQLRRSLGLKPLRRIFRWWWLSPELVIGLFPLWYGAPQPDWPPQVRLAGFPLEHPATTGDLPENLLRFCRPPGPIVAFTFGTGMRHASELFRTAVEVCQLLKIRAILLTSARSQVAGELPEFAHYCAHAPFRELFPLCAAVVHHGGIGTVANALAAGTPQLILPFAYDQLDNAVRVKKLGAGDWLLPRQLQSQRIASALAELMTPRTAAAAQGVSRLLIGQSGVKRAADEVEARFRVGS